MAKARTETSQQTISGLLAKREELLEELGVMRQRDGAIAR